MSSKKGRVWYQESRTVTRVGNKRQKGDPEDEPGFPDLIDPEDEPGFPDLIDPEDEPGFPDLIDPEDEPGFPDLIDPEDEPGFPDLIDPEDEPGFPDLIDPDGNRKKQPGSPQSAPLWGDYSSGRPGGVGKDIEYQYSGRIVIRLASRYAYEEYPTLQALVADEEKHGNDLKGLKDILEGHNLPDAPRHLFRRRYKALPDAGEDHPEPDEEPLYLNRELDRLKTLEQKAAGNALAPLHSLAAYWRVEANAISYEDRTELLRRLNDLAEVDRAYRELAASDPGTVKDPYYGAQGYLDPAPVGIDARWAAQVADGLSKVGKEVKLVDLEQGWIPEHREFEPRPALIHGDNRHNQGDYKGYHGTAVLGEIASKDNESGVVGIAPGVAWIGLSSHFDLGTKSNGHVADAIYAAIRPPEGTDKPFLAAGDVLLLEVQRSFLPAEVDDADFDAIRLASSLGVIVVEAAGNGGRDLDAFRKRGRRIFNRRSGGHRESGAIMVGAARAALPHNRKRASNYGSRVDCYAWGNRVVTSGYGDLGANHPLSTVATLSTDDEKKCYTADFSNTSAAAPIIAGAALAVQGAYIYATGGARLMAGQMRAVLADPATGTRQGGRVRGHIGVMPNLRAIFRRTLRIVPDVYLRDRVGDTGAAPASRFCTCPDVLVTQRKPDDPQAVYGEGSDNQNDPNVGFKAVKTDTNYVYVRMRNRGRCDAKMLATVYWSAAATLVTPDMWHEIGCCRSLVEVPQGDTLTVSSSITWDDLPDIGYYCLIALLEDAIEPRRLPPGLLATKGYRARRKQRRKLSNAKAIARPNAARRADLDAFDWQAYLAFLRANSHLAVRNLHVVDDLEPDKKIAFLVTGTPEADRGRFFDLEILQRLPKDAELSFYVPRSLAPALSVGGSWTSEIDEDDSNYLRFDLPSIPRAPFLGVPIAAGAAHGCYFRIKKGTATEGHSIAVRQLYRGQEVGRITFNFGRR